jgi:hypothetical protein
MADPTAKQTTEGDDDEMAEVGRALEEEDVAGQRQRNATVRKFQLVDRSVPQYVR